MEKWPSIPEERLKKYREIFENFAGGETLPQHVLEHLQRMTEINGEGIELLSYRNKDYLGAFMSPFSRDLEKADVAIVGIPIEVNSPITSSHKEGPTYLRRISKQGMGTVSDLMDVPFDMCRIIDYGNIDVYGLFDLKKEIQMAEEHLMKIVVDNGVTPFVWGGDHSISYPPLKACGEKHGPVGVIHFDAHFDLITRAAYDNIYTSGHWLSRAMSEGYVDPERTIQIGMRGRQSSLVKEFADKFGTTWFSSDDVWDLGAKYIAEKVVEVVGEGPVYITVDLDVLDPTYHSSNSSPDPFGITSRQLYDILRHARKAGTINLVGADVSEHAPLNDPTLKDAIVASGISWKILCWLADERAKRQGEWRKTQWPLAMGYASL